MNFDDVGCNIKLEKMVLWLSYYYFWVVYLIWDVDEEFYILYFLGIIILRLILLLCIY